MNDRYEIRKRLTIIIWIFASTVPFWLGSKLPNQFDLGSFLTNLMLLFGGGFAFHFLSELLGAPAFEANWSLWGDLAKCLSRATFIILSVFGIAYFEMYIFSLGGLLSFLAIFPAIWFSISEVEKSSKILRQIKNFQ